MGHAASAGSGTTVGDSASTDSSTDAHGSSTGAGPTLDCLPSDAAITCAGITAISPGWLDGGHENVSCTAVGVESDPVRVVLSCVEPMTLAETEVRINVTEGALDDQLDDLPGSELRASFYHPPEDSIGCIACNHVTLREANGDLILLGHIATSYDSYPVEGTGFDVGMPGWLRPGTPESEAWSAPFDRLVSIYDRNAAYSVQVEGQTFDVLVSDAFFRGPLNCGDCPATEADFLVIRSAR